MVNRRRSSILGLGSLAAGLLWPLAAAAVEVQLRADGEHLRFAVPDALYQAGLSTDFSELQVLDQREREVPFAVCTVFAGAQQDARAPVLGVPDTTRAELQADGSVLLTTPPGVAPASQVVQLIVDLRAIKGPVHRLDGLPPVARLRESPNLRQWGPALSFRQTGNQILFEARPLQFLRVELQSAIDPAPAALTVGLQALAATPQPHWYEPQAQSAGRYLSRRQLPVIAARLHSAKPGLGWSLESRQADWDAWKPRGQIAPGATESALFFSAVTDPQWRLRSEGEETLQLAHAEHELRIPSLADRRELRLRLRSDKRRRPALSCRATEGLALAAPASLEVRDAATSNGADGPRNLRSRFLLLAAIGALLGFAARWWWRRRQGRTFRG